MAYYCALRGNKDHMLVRMADIGEGEFGPEHGEDLDGMAYIYFDIFFSKGTRITAKHPFIKTNQRNRLYIPDCIDIPGWSGYQIMKWYLSLTHPSSVSFYCKPIVKEDSKAKWSQNGYQKTGILRNVEFYPSGNGVAQHNLGPTKITEYFKELAKLIGVPDFEACTGHAIRALNITNAVEGNLNANDVANMARQSSTSKERRLTYAPKSGPMVNLG